MYTVYIDLKTLYSGNMMKETELKERIRRAENARDNEAMYSAAWSYWSGAVYAYERVLRG